MKEASFLKVSKKEQPIDGVTLGTYHVLRGDKFTHVYNITCTFLFKRWRFVLCSSASRQVGLVSFD